MLTSLYVHIPFCEHICTYCDFHKSLATETKKEKYVQALMKELKHRQNDLVNIRTIYIGGGTPLSLSTPLLTLLLSTIQEVVNLQNVVEYTIETNPNNLSADRIKLLQQYGINRVSIGVQTFDPIQLQHLGRDHTLSDIKEGITLLREAHFPNISVDLIFSLIGQTLEDVQADLDQVLQLDVDHISYYSLILEERTILYHQYLQGMIALNSEDLEGDMFQLVMDTLIANGYEHYEISNFAKPNKQSEHNKAYWLNHDFIGLGSGAHSHQQGTRYYHVANSSTYIDQMEQEEFTYAHIEDVDDCLDRLLVGLRMMNGIDIATYDTECGCSIFDRFPDIQQHINNQLLEHKDGRLRLTTKGIRLGNIVFMTFLEES